MGVAVLLRLSMRPGGAHAGARGAVQVGVGSRRVGVECAVAEQDGSGFSTAGSSDRRARHVLRADEVLLLLRREENGPVGPASVQFISGHLVSSRTRELNFDLPSHCVSFFFMRMLSDVQFRLI